MASQSFGASYSAEWKAVFDNPNYLEKIKGLALRGDLRNFIGMRSTCWKIFLGCLPEDKSTWVGVTRNQRQNYERIMDKYSTNPRNDRTLDLCLNNPLSQSDQSPWNRYFEDNELKVTIRQDVVRTFPENEFFRILDVQKFMINILFNYAREFPHVSYKQGMHELLAPILYVLHTDQMRSSKDAAKGRLLLDPHILLNQNYIEHDAFVMFSQLMSKVETWYTTESPYSENIMSFTPEPEEEAVVTCMLSLQDTLLSINRNHLKKFDNDLFCHLERLEITPQIYGIRWLRLLFGREFQLDDLLSLWDAIFSDSKDLFLVEFVFVAMLVSIKELLIESDYASCLKYLMRFPHVEDVQFIIDLALHLREPLKHKRPESISKRAFNRLLLKEGKQGGYKGVSKGSKDPSSSLIKVQSTSKQTIETRPKSLSIAGVNKLWSNIAESPSSDIRTKSSSFSEKHYNPGSSDVSDISDEFLNVAISSSQNLGASSTLPRTSIRNVMESRTHQFRATDLSQSPGQESSKNILSESTFRELVPLATPTSKVQVLKENKPLPTDNAEKLRVLKQKMASLKKTNNHCTEQLTLHLSKLKFFMMNEKLVKRDEMFNALEGIQRARDILQESTRFSEDVVDDDLNSTFIQNLSAHSHLNREDQQRSSSSDDEEESVKEFASE